MNTIIFTLILLIVVAGVIYRYSAGKPASKENPSSQHPEFKGLFAEELEEEARHFIGIEEGLRREARRRELLEKAASGDLSTLEEADAAGDDELYKAVLGSLTRWAAADPDRVRKAAAHIVKSDSLRGSVDFANLAIEALRGPLSGGRGDLGCLLQAAALSDDAASYNRAVDAALGQWHSGRLPELSAKDFIDSVEGAYWLLGAETRCSGPGFAVKQTIADVRRDLAAAARRSE